MDRIQGEEGETIGTTYSNARGSCDSKSSTRIRSETCRETSAYSNGGQYCFDGTSVIGCLKCSLFLEFFLQRILSWMEWVVIAIILCILDMERMWIIVLEEVVWCIHERIYRWKNGKRYSPNIVIKSGWQQSTRLCNLVLWSVYWYKRVLIQTII